MAQQYITTLERVLEVSPESPFSTVGSYVRQTFTQDSYEDGRVTEQLEVQDSSAELMDAQTSLDGFKRSSPSWKQLVKGNATQLDSAAAGAALVLATQNPNLLVPSYIMGGTAIAAGSAVVASPAPTTTSFSVTAAGGASFPQGTVVMVEIGTPGSGTLEPNVVLTRSTDALTFVWAFSSVPVTTNKIINMAQLYVDNANVQSYSVREANRADAAEQYEHTKCTGDFELNYSRGQLLSMGIKSRAAKWRGPDATVFGSIPAYAADIHGCRGFALKDAVTLLQPVATATRVQYAMSNLAVAMKQGMVHTESHGTDGVDSVMRTGNRDFAECTITGPWDRTLATYAAAKTPLRLFHWVPNGSGNTLKAFALHIAKGYIYGEPVRKNAAGIAQAEYKFRSLIDPTLTTKLLKSPLVFACG